MNHHARGDYATGGYKIMDWVHERWRALAEMFTGIGLMSLPYWGHLADNIVVGAHLITAITGAAIGLNGVYRIFFRKRRRATDRATDLTVRSNGPIGRAAE